MSSSRRNREASRDRIPKGGIKIPWVEDAYVLPFALYPKKKNRRISERFAPAFTGQVAEFSNN